MVGGNFKEQVLTKYQYHMYIINIVYPKDRIWDTILPLLLCRDSPYMFLVMAFTKTLEYEWTALVLGKSHFLLRDNSPRSTVQLVIHQPCTFTSATLFDILFVLYVYSGAFVFKFRNDIKRVTTLLSGYFARFGL